MSVTIDSLDIQIRSSAGSAAKNIEELADKLGNLNQNAKVTKIVNSLGNLNKALSDMKGQQAVMSHLSALSKSLSSLAAIPKLTGLQSAVRELKKLPEVMSGLGTAEISQFTAKMKLLASGLSPLATQIDKISKGFSKLPPQVSKCVTAVKRLDSANKSAASSAKKHGDALKSQSFSILAAYENLENVFGMMHGVQDAFTKLMDDAIQWDGIQFRFGRAFGEDADMVLEYAQKVSDELRINMQQFMQYSSLYGSLLSGFGMAQKQVTTISVGLTELSYDIWAAYNDRYRTLEDASEAVRSAITGEIEPIRNAGIALTEASMQEYLDSIGMASTSVEKLTEAQKSELRYAVMVNSAMQQGIVGTYAREMDTAEGAIRTLTQQLKTLGQAIGSLFLPILQTVVPWLTAFVELLTEGVAALAKFFGISFKEIQWGDPTGMKQTAEGASDAADALGDAAKNAKKMMDYTMGFDELNVIKPPSESGGGASGATGAGNGSLGLDLGTLWDNSVFASASKQVDELKAKIVDFFNEWRWQIEAFGAGTMLIALGNIVEKLKEAEIFSGGFLRNMNTISKFGLSAVIITLQWMLVSEFLENFIEEGSWEEYIKAAIVAALGTWALGAQWGPTGVVIGLGVTAVASFKATFEDGSVDSIEEITTGLTGLAAAAAGVGVMLKKTDLGAALKLLFSGAKFSKVFAAWFPKLSTVISTATGWVTGTLVPGIVAALGKLAAALGMSLGATAAAVAAVVVGAIVAAILVVKYWDEIKFFFTDTLPKWFEETGAKIGSFFSGAWEKIKEIWGVVAQWFNDSVIQPLVDFFAPIVDWIGEFFRGCWMIVRAVWVVVSEWFHENVITPLVDKFGEFKETVGGFFSNLWTGVKNVWKSVSSWFNTTVVTPVVGWFRGAWTSISGFFSSLWTDVKGVWVGVSTWFNTNVIKPVVNFFSTAWKNISTAFENAFNGIATFATNVFNGIIGSVEGIINGVIDGINWLLGGFNQVVTWAASILKEDWGGLTLIQRVELPRLADGGFVGAGQMFIAREAGPELVGNINGRTAVANNDQIVAAVSQGVYSAVVAAMSASSGSGGQSVNVYLDGRQITAAVEKRQSERGMQLIGNQLGYAY